jgi:hypothetical protein
LAEKHENLWISALKDWICDKYVIFLLLFTCLIILKDIGILSDLLIKVIGKDKLAICEEMGWNLFSCISHLY